MLFLFIILAIIGLVLAFFGKTILESIAFLIGAILGATFAFMLATSPAVQARVGAYIPLNWCIIIAVILGALIGGYLGKSLMYGLISLVFAGLCSYLALTLTGDTVIALIVFFIALIVMWFLVERFLAVMTAFLGAWLTATAVMMLTVGLGFLAYVLFILIIAVLTIFGAKYQLSKS